MSPARGVTAADVAGARIAVRRLGSRYDIDQVDRFLDECRSTLEAWERSRDTTTALSAADVASTTFGSPRGLTPGYDADAVDDLLDTVVLQLREYSG
ncbi:DivIVA domain-containing protein [Microbacterium sp. 1.5R]|uniref:DivIVA domain-containing protein n=1 Tax=Microbacterium sp. 1.5R TaxID=1916917 RepID=UPI00119CFA48|nr:DivIVA domain-containing protein [Microbacterium sp. 1.5R]